MARCISNGNRSDLAGSLCQNVTGFPSRWGVCDRPCPPMMRVPDYHTSWGSKLVPLLIVCTQRSLHPKWGRLVASV
jgi:hypothetical protein